MLEDIRLLTRKFTEWAVVIILIVATIQGMIEGQLWKGTFFTLIGTPYYDIDGIWTPIFGAIGGFVFFFAASLVVSLVLAILNIDRNIAALVGKRRVSGSDSSPSDNDNQGANKAKPIEPPTNANERLVRDSSKDRPKVF